MILPLQQEIFSIEIAETVALHPCSNVIHRVSGTTCSTYFSQIRKLYTYLLTTARHKIYDSGRENGRTSLKCNLMIQL